MRKADCPGRDAMRLRGGDRRTSDVTVLVIEDDWDVNLLISSRLQRDGFHVVTAETERKPRLALSTAPRPDHAGPSPAAVDGFGVLLMLCSLPEMKQIPVIVLTGLTGDAAEASARAWQNVVRFVRKPVNVGDVSRITREVLHLPDES